MADSLAARVERSRLNPNEIRRALIGALARGPAEGWVRLELAETLARAEYKRGAADAHRAIRRRLALAPSHYGADRPDVFCSDRNAADHV